MHASASDGGPSELGEGAVDAIQFDVGVTCPLGATDPAGATELAGGSAVVEHPARTPAATRTPRDRRPGANLPVLVSMRLISVRLYTPMERSQPGITEGSPPGTTELVILGLIAFGERSGYDLAQQVERSVGYLWGPSRSQIYKVLPRLVARGLARARTLPQPDRPDKVLYRVTPAGRRVLRSWLEEVDAEPAGGPNVFVLKLFFCDLVPARAARAQLTTYRGYLTRRVERFESMLRELDEVERVFPQLVLRRAIARIRTSLAWTDEVAAVVDGTGEVE